MNKFTLFLLLLIISSLPSFAQCDQLFISEYVESGFNNRALEIYNPTNQPIDLSEYMVARFSNGGIEPIDVIQLPPVLLNPFDVYVAISDKRDPNGACLEEPILDGWVLVDILLDSYGDPILDENGNSVEGIQFEEVLCADGTVGISDVESNTYYEQYDLEGKGDGFFCPQYNINRTFYWNGNDAVALIHGTSFLIDYSNVIDVVGVIGEDPINGAWTDSQGFLMTSDATLIKNPEIEGGSVQSLDASDSYPDVFNSGDWFPLPKYSFSTLGYHSCSCDPNYNGFVNQISVFLFSDLNENGVFDEGEFPLNNQYIDLSPNALTSFSNAEGLVTFYVNSGTFSLEYVVGDLWELSEDGPWEVEIGNTEALDTTLYIPLTPVGNFTIQNIDLSSSITRCNQETNFWLTYLNKGTVPTSGYIEFIPDDLGEFVSANPPVDSIAGEKIYWFYENLAPTYSNQILLIYEMPGVDNLGTILSYEASIETYDGLGGDQTSLTSELICAYDPNDKIASPSNYGAENYTLFGDTLEYTIRFQNTGNDTAFNVLITDELSEFVDLNTFEFITSSHPVRTQIKIEERLIEFYFDDIYLPDSFVNEVASHGLVKFKIMGNADLAENTVIKNHAEIYFDQNPPIITNEVSNEMVSVLPDLSIISASPILLDFGNFAIDEASYTNEILTLNNAGELPLIINEFSFGDPVFSSSEIDLPLIIEGFGIYEMPIKFAPIGEGNYESELLVESNSGSLTVNLVGNATEATGFSSLNNPLFNVYPNPNNGKFVIEMEETTNLKVKIQNSLGEIIFVQEEITDLVKIDLSGQSTGLYFVSLKTDKGISNQKIILH